MESSFGATIRHGPVTTKKPYPNAQSYHNDSVNYAFTDTCNVPVLKSPAATIYPHFPPPPDYPPPKNSIAKVRKVAVSSANAAARHCDGAMCSGHNGQAAHQRYQYSNHMDSVNWSRNNIAATMEQYHPSTSSVGGRNGNAQDYSYAYYEPRVTIRNASNSAKMMTTYAGDGEMAGPSKAPPPNSMRALMSTARRNSSNKLLYMKKMNSPENIYEEIVGETYSSGSMHMMSNGSSMISLSQSMVEEEFRQVQNRHQRVLGELNLSVEEMLMPASPTNQCNAHEDERNLSSLTENISLSSNSRQSTLGVDMDSGFSGSSSNTSYIGSLRYNRNCPHSVTRTSTPSCATGTADSLYGGSSRSSGRSHESSQLMSFYSRSSSSVYGDSMRCMRNQTESSSATNSPKSKTSKLNFWSRKGWRKISGFSSSSTVDKIGLGNDNPNLNTNSWDDALPNANSVNTIASDTILPLANYYNCNPIHQSNSSSVAVNTKLISTSNKNINNNCNNHISSSNLQNNSNIINSSSNHNINKGKRGDKLEHSIAATTKTVVATSDDSSWSSDTAGGIRVEREVSSDDENASDRSLTSGAQRNSQLRTTFNKAKNHLSFDKWRSNSLNSSNSSGGGTVTTTMPTNQESPPGESFSRLSRWFSMRRGSIHQYDIRSGAGSAGAVATERDNRRNSLDSSLHNEELHNSRMAKITSSSGGGGGISGGGSISGGTVSKKMPKLPESEEDTTIYSLELDLSQNNNLFTMKGERGRPMPPTLPAAPPGLTEQQIKRRHIVAAIIHSENSYVATLQRLVNDYKKPLEDSSPGILSSSKIATLFHRLPEILQCHTLFRIALADFVRNWDRDEKIGDIFIASFSKSIVLDIYSGFINNFSVAMDLAKMEAKRKSALADFLKVKQISAHDRLSFFGLMVKPVQRFPQFILFLQDLLKYTPQGHHDRMSLQLALTQLESLAEMLNERKREAEQNQAFKEMLSHISNSFNTRFLSASENGRNRYLLREDNVTQLEFNQSGFIVKSKKRRLLLLNDKIICVSVAPKQSHDFGSTEKLSFKWMYPVMDIIVDNSSSATLSRILPAGINKGGSLKSNTSFGETNTVLTNDADNLCNDMSNLMHDYEIISRVNVLVGSLKGCYNDINVDVTKKVLASIQNSIQKKDEEMSWVDSCCLQIIAKNKSGKEETLTFQTENPSVKKEWITELRLAQLALDQNNSPAWEIPDHEHRPLTKMPLFVKSQSIYKSQQQTEVRCGCYYTITNKNFIPSAKRLKNTNYLWVCSTDSMSSHINILSHQQQEASVLKSINSFDLDETLVTSMEFIRDAAESSNDTVWISTNNKKILIYSAQNPEHEEQHSCFTLPHVATKILYHMNNVFISLSNNDIIIVKRGGSEGKWDFENYKTVTLETESISCLLSITPNVYAACGKRVCVLDGNTGDVQKCFDVQHGNSNVNLMAHSGIGLWISLKNSSIICLYHTETFKLLQDINIASNVLRVTSSNSGTLQHKENSSVFVTSLMACKGLLWVGTNVGIALTIPLPRLEGVPIISGGVNISYHAHFGPVTFLLPLIVPNNKSNNSHAHLPADETSSQNVSLNVSDHNSSDVSPSKLNDSIGTDDETKTNKNRKLDKQNSFDLTTKLKAQLTNSPVVLRRRRMMPDDARTSKTLPRGLGSSVRYFTSSIRSTTSSSQGSDPCDIYGLYSDLIFVKENYETEEAQGNILNSSYECLNLRCSDPELAAIPAKVSTLDRKLKMKVSRPRSLDLSNWSVDSRSSSLYTSSGSEENIGNKMYNNGRSVSRNSSSASHKFNGVELGGISEVVGVENSSSLSTNAEEDEKIELQTNQIKMSSTPNESLIMPNGNSNNNHNTNISTTKRKKNGKNQMSSELCNGKRTILTLMGGRGYINWRHVWFNNTDTPKQQTHQRSNSITVSRLPNSNDAHIIIWEKKL